MLSELRKYRVGLVLANQYLAQLEEPIRDALLGNVGTLIAFRHSAFGFVPDVHREGLARGWAPLLDRIRQQAEARTRRDR